MKFTIEPGTSADIDELEKLYDELNDYLAATTNYPGWIKGVYPVREDAVAGVNDETLYVARYDGRIVGSVILNHLFWTMVDGRERNDLYGIYEEVIAEMGFPVLSTRLPDSKKFRRDLSEERRSVFRSTIFPMDTALLKGSGIREFSEEISDIIRPQ